MPKAFACAAVYHPKACPKAWHVAITSHNQKYYLRVLSAPAQWSTGPRQSMVEGIDLSKIEYVGTIMGHEVGERVYPEHILSQADCNKLWNDPYCFEKVV